MGLTQHVPSKNMYAYNSGPRGSPDMILSAFYVKFHEKKDELPPGAWNPQTKINKRHKQKQNNASQNGSPRTAARPAERGVQGAPAPRENPCV